MPGSTGKNRSVTKTWFIMLINHIEWAECTWDSIDLLERQLLEKRGIAIDLFGERQRLSANAEIS